MAPSVFVSCEDARQSAPLVAALEARGVRVVHSPLPGNDARWADWYQDGCRDAMADSDCFIAVVTRGYGCSTWMAHEAEMAVKLLRATGRPKLCLVRMVPSPLTVGFKPLQEVARDLGGAVDEVAASIVAITHGAG